MASISNAAGIVSIRTVALIVPRSRPSSSSAITKASRHSAASSRSRASECRSTGRGRARAAPRRCGACRARSRRRRPAGSLPSILMWRSGRCRPRGRTSSTACSSSRRYCLSSSSCSIEPRAASARFTCPPIMFDHVGECESSKSAMNARAPEFSALMTILRDAGPVISTRRSASASGTGATVKSSGAATKDSVPPASSSAWRSWRASSSSTRRASSSSCRRPTSASAPLGEHLVIAVAARSLDAGLFGHAVLVNRL